MPYDSEEFREWLKKALADSIAESDAVLMKRDELNRRIEAAYNRGIDVGYRNAAELLARPR